MLLICRASASCAVAAWRFLVDTEMIPASADARQSASVDMDQALMPSCSSFSNSEPREKMK
jgi:hypothetical protein